MKKLKTSSGLTLMELLASLLVLTLLVTAMGTGMDAALGSWRDSLFHTNSAALEAIVNTTLGDLLRYARDIRHEVDGVVFTNGEYGVQTGSFAVSEDGMLQLQNGNTGQMIQLLNSGVYTGLKITDFQAVYVEPGRDGKRGGYFEITYTIQNSDASKVRFAETVVRVLNIG